MITFILVFFVIFVFSVSVHTIQEIWQQWPIKEEKEPPWYITKKIL